MTDVNRTSTNIILDEALRSFQDTEAMVFPSTKDLTETEWDKCTVKDLTNPKAEPTEISGLEFTYNLPLMIDVKDAAGRLSFKSLTARTAIQGKDGDIFAGKAWKAVSKVDAGNKEIVMKRDANEGGPLVFLTSVLSTTEEGGMERSFKHYVVCPVKAED
ncbi:MAG: hypothetical protein H7A33_00150 [Deltaproteobacteria bacterium]|nr:hypothetical protein [Deltaproteobacteria bacterium]